MTWQLSAPCASADPDAWFPEDGGNAHQAKRICRSCQYKAPCLIGAIERKERYGVWAGVSPRDFPRIRRELQEAS